MMEEYNYLVLVRHGQSEWNEKNLFTGWRDPDLTQMGKLEAKKAGELLLSEGIKFDELFTSVLTRAISTGKIILDRLSLDSISTCRDKALNERDYGELSGLIKMMQESAGEKIKCISGGVHMMFLHPVAKALKKLERESCLSLRIRYSLLFLKGKMCLSPRTETH